MTYDGKPLSPAAQLDDAEYLAKLARDLSANEPLEALRRSPPAPRRDELGPMLYQLGRMVAMMEMDEPQTARPQPLPYTGEPPRTAWNIALAAVEAARERNGSRP